MKEMTGLNFKINEMARRIKELREIVGFTPAEMAEKTDMTIEDYIACERGEKDLTFAFLYRCAIAFNVDVNDIIEGKSPVLASYTVTRSGEGLEIDHAHGMEYYNLAAAFKNKICEPLFVRCDPNEGSDDIALTTHAGQELDIVVSGTLRVQIGNHVEILHPGDTIYFDSSTPHGMIAVDKEETTFYALVFNPAGEVVTPKNTIDDESPKRSGTGKRIYHNFIHPKEDENGKILSLSYENEDKFNFAFDIVDGLGKKLPDKLAMLHIDKNKNERRFSFKDMMEYSAQTANYFKSLGIKKGDRVMIVLKRHYQFWFSILALHKIGAIAIPATHLLQEHDLDYRFNAAGVSAILCTSDDDTAHQVDLAAKNSPTLKTKIIVGEPREGWHDFNDEVKLFSKEFERTEESACGNDKMLMFFTSGTTGYPKIATHNFKYPLGHFVTANYWHCVNPEGLHLTISDTGWAKALWGKLYGQWLCEAAVFTYDFDKFSADDILPLFKQYNITTFCAPPTMYRFFIKEDLSKYDLSSLVYSNTAGEALNPEVFYQWKKATGLDIMEGFGQTETTLVICNQIGDTPKPGSMGKPSPLYDVDIVGPDDKPVQPGETGEIVIRTDKKVPYGLFLGYYNDPENTKKSWHDGLFHTGDTAWRDEDGYFWYVGRVDDLIKSSGYRIGPFEIESVIMELPYILECAITAAPDPIRGQVVKATIVLTKGTNASDELKKEIQTYVKVHTAPYKYPRIVEFVEELPKTISGKIKRVDIRKNDSEGKK